MCVDSLFFKIILSIYSISIWQRGDDKSKQPNKLRYQEVCYEGQISQIKLNFNYLNFHEKQDVLCFVHIHFSCKFRCR